MKRAPWKVGWTSSASTLSGRSQIGWQGTWSFSPGRSRRSWHSLYWCLFVSCQLHLRIQIVFHRIDVILFASQISILNNIQHYFCVQVRDYLFDKEEKLFRSLEKAVRLLVKNVLYYLQQAQVLSHKTTELFRRLFLFFSKLWQNDEFFLFSPHILCKHNCVNMLLMSSLFRKWYPWRHRMRMNLRTLWRIQT